MLFRRPRQRPGRHASQAEFPRLDPAEAIDGFGYGDRLQPLAHQPLDLQCQHTEEDVRPDPILRPVIQRPQHQGALESPPPPLDLRQFLVPANDLLRRQVHVRRLQEEHPANRLLPGTCLPVGPDNHLAVDEIDLVERQETMIPQVIPDAIVGPLGRCSPPTPCGIGELVQTVGDESVRPGQASLSLFRHFPGDLRGVCQHEPHRCPLFAEELLLPARPVKPGFQLCDHGGGDLASSQRVRHDEPQLLVQDRLQVLVGEHPPIPHKDHIAQIEPAPDVPHDFRHRRLVHRVSGEDVMTKRDAVPGHHHPDRDLPPIEPPVPAVAVPPEVVLSDRPVSFEISRGDVVENQVHRLIEQGQELLRDHRLRLLLDRQEAVHGAQKVVVRRTVLLVSGEVDTIEPLQERQLAAGIAHPIDHHQPHQVRHRERGFPGNPQVVKDLVEPEAVPGLADGIDMPEVPGREKLADPLFGGFPTQDPMQTRDEPFDLFFTQVLQGSQVGQDAGAGGASLVGIPVALGDLEGAVLPVPLTLAGNADVHALHNTDPITLCQEL